MPIRPGLFAFFISTSLILSSSVAPALAANAAPADLHAYFLGPVSGVAAKYFTVALRDGTTERDAIAVASYFRGYGLVVTIDAENGLLFVRGTYGQASAAAHVGFERGLYRGLPFVTMDRPETYPAVVASHILATTLNDGVTAHGGGMSPDVGVADANGYTPPDIDTYYDFGSIETSGDEGSGQTAAYVSCGAIATADLNQFESLYGLPTNTPTFVNVDGGSTTTDFPDTGVVERLIGTAPKASITVYVIPNSCLLSNIADAVAKVLSDDTTKKYRALVEPYGNSEDVYQSSGSESDLTAESTNFGKLVAKKTTIFTTNGDNGAYSFLEPGDVGVYYPASDPNVVGVGTTTATSVSATNPTRSFESASYASGGGSSVDFAIPAWQKGVAGMISTTQRNVPDVAFNGDCHTWYQATYAGSNSYDVCGGAYGASTWAGLLLLVDAGRKTAGKSALSGLSATLYANRTTADFYTDITEGCNGFYCAGSGWDAVSGLGSPNASVVYSTLVALP
jgi:kumamolisin